MENFVRDFVAENELIEDVLDNVDFKKIIFVRQKLNEYLKMFEDWAYTNFISYDEEPELRKDLRSLLKSALEGLNSESPRLTDSTGEVYYEWQMKSIFNVRVMYYEKPDENDGKHYYYDVSYDIEEMNNYM